MRTHRFVRHTAVLLALGLLGGCAGQDSDLNGWISEVKSRPAGPLEPIPDIPEYDKFLYEAHGLRDPFALYRRADSGITQGPKPDSNRPKEPLEDFTLDSLKMVGTLGTGARQAALIMDPNNVTHRVYPGQHMGRQDGRVVGIEPGRIVLIELASDKMGGWEEIQTVVNLSEVEDK